MWLIGAGAILSVGLLRSIEWAKMEKRFDVDGGVSGGAVLHLMPTSHALHPVTMVATDVYNSCLSASCQEHLQWTLSELFARFAAELSCSCGSCI